MSEDRKECYNCNYFSKCYERALYGSIYCNYHRKENRWIKI